MHQLNSNQWFTEFNHPFNQPEKAFAAFSLKIKQKLHEEQTAYQKIEIYETESFGNLMVMDGFVMLTQRDNFLYHEMMTHPALFSHPDPKQVAIIGGGDCGTIKEVLKHSSVEKVTQIEIDQRVTELSEQFFPELCQANQDPRAHFLFDDGVAWIKQAQPNSLDIIIIDCTDPIGAAVGLFTPEFYQNCVSALSEKGILVAQTESPFYNLEFIHSIRSNLKEIGFMDARTLSFPQPTYPSGFWSATIAKKNCTLEHFRYSDVRHKNFKTKYYNESVHKAALAEPEFMRKA